MAGSELGSLYYDLNIDDKNLGKQLDSADKQVKEFGKGVSESGEQLKKGLLKTSAGFAVVGAGLTLAAKNATDFTTDLVKSSSALGRQLGISTTEASRLVAALGRMGIDSQKASQMFGVFSKNIVASTENAGKAADAFSKLGVSTRDAEGKQKDFNTILFEVSDKFKAMPDGIDKTAVAMELFGKQGKEMIKVLNMGSEEIKNLEKRADELGLTLNDKTIESIRGLVESQKKLKESTDSMKIAVGTATSPVLTEFNTILNDIIQNLLGMDGPVRGVTVAFLAFAGPIFTAASAVLALAASLVQVWPALMGFAGAVRGATVAMWGLTVAILSNPITWLVLAIVGIGVAIAMAIVYFDELGAYVVTVMDRVGMAIKGVWNWIVGNWPLLVGILLGPFAYAVSMIIQNWQQIYSFFSGVAGAIGRFIGGVTSAIVDPFKRAFNAVVGAWNSTVGKISFKAPSWVPGFGGKGWSMPKFAKGAIATGPTVGMFGEAGTEAVLPLSYLNRYNTLFDRIENMATGKGDTTFNGGGTTVNIGTIQDRQDADYIIRRLDRNSQLENIGLSPA